LILDDKEGAYQYQNGVSKGRIRFSDHPNWAKVKGGSLILLYNHKNKNKHIQSDDPTDSDTNRIYITPLAQPYFYGEQLNHEQNYFPVPPAWDLIWLYNRNDQINIRSCEGNLLYRVSYGYDDDKSSIPDKQVNIKEPAEKGLVYRNLVDRYSISDAKPSPGKFNNRRHKRNAKSGK